MWRVTVLDLQLCSNVRPSWNATKGFFRNPRAGFIYFFNFSIEVLEDCTLPYQIFWRFIYKREKCCLYKCRCLVLCLGSGGEIELVLFFPSSFGLEFLSYHHHIPYLGSRSCHPLGTSFTSVAWSHMIHSCFNCKNTRICCLKRNHILTQNIFLHVSSSHVLEETATSEALSNSLCPQTKPLSVVPFPLHPFRRLLIPVVFWFLGF